MEKAWVVAVNMGYGHQRAAYSLRDFAYKGKVICANDYEGIPERDRFIWEESRALYEAISRFKRVPLFGKPAFYLFNKLQGILEFYPKRNLSRPDMQVRQIYGLIKRGWGKDLIARLGKKPLPLITTFYAPAFAAEYYGYPNEIYLVICDTDIARSWVPLDPQNSRINYCVPNVRTYERLKLYGIKKRRIFLTGFPLPAENISSHTGARAWTADRAVSDIAYRLLNLDPNGIYLKKYQALVRRTLGKLPQEPNHQLTILFSIGGAGAQKEIGLAAAKSLAPKLKTGEAKLILSAGCNWKLKNYCLEEAAKLGLDQRPGFEILYEADKDSYFEKFNNALRVCDILWTKPSELSFFAALGLPIVIAPPIGSQEDFNMSWLIKSGFGIMQEDPKCADQWLFDWIKQGYLAEAAMQGLVEGEKLGTYHIQRIVLGEHN